MMLDVSHIKASLSVPQDYPEIVLLSNRRIVSEYVQGLALYVVSSRTKYEEVEYV